MTAAGTSPVSDSGPIAGKGARRAFWITLAAFTLLHLLLAAALPLSGDEAYYWDCSRHLDWSYFDQPPLVIWSMVPARAVLGETRIAVRAPAIACSLLTGLFLLGLVRRLGGGHREATLAYMVLHGMPLFFVGSFYTSTDVAMSSAWIAVTWAAAALAQGEERAWWGLSVALGLGFLAKFPIVLALPALLPAVLQKGGPRRLLRPRPWLAALCAGVLTTPVWIWAVEHGWANIVFQLQGRHHRGGFTLKYLGEFVAANLLLASPLLAVAMAIACWRARSRSEPAWRVMLVATAMPFLAFGLVALRTRVGAHWGGPGLLLAAVPLVLTRFRSRRVLVTTGAVLGLALSAAAIAMVSMPEKLVGVEWSYRGRAHRINTKKLAAAIGNPELVARVEAARQPHELVASESYTMVHLLAFWTQGRLPTRLAHVKPGKHGLASLYWYRPQELTGADVLFVTEKHQVDERLREVFEEVREEEPIQIVRGGEEVRTVRLLRCRNLLRPGGVFARLEP